MAEAVRLVPPLAPEAALGAAAVRKVNYAGLALRVVEVSPSPQPSPPGERERRGALGEREGWALSQVAALREEEWGRAFEVWLGGKAANTQRAYGRAWEDLLRFTGKQPWEMLAGDVRAWAEDLGRRALDGAALLGLERKGRRSRGDGEGLSASTIAQWLSAVSSFFRFVTTRYVVPCGDGRERPLHDYNPTLTVARPDVSQYARAEYLDSEELGRLLAAIPRRTAAALRDYALILGYVLTGRRNSEWRTLRWGDLRARGAQVFYTWRGKNTDGARNEVPPPVWEAVLAFLEAAGRLEGMGAEDYVFRALSDNATRLPAYQRAHGDGWDANRPLTGEAVNRILKKYAKRAGLDARKVHVHVLRHSAAMLEDELGSGLAEVVKFLGHADPKTTMRYLGHLRGRPDRTWERKCAVLGVGEQTTKDTKGTKDRDGNRRWGNVPGTGV